RQPDARSLPGIAATAVGAPEDAAAARTGVVHATASIDDDDVDADIDQAGVDRPPGALAVRALEDTDALRPGVEGVGRGRIEGQCGDEDALGKPLAERLPDAIIRAPEHASADTARIATRRRSSIEHFR